MNFGLSLNIFEPTWNWRDGVNVGDIKNMGKLRKEVRGLELLIKDISREVVEDVVTGSSPVFPYGKHKIIVRGVDQKRLHSLRIRLINKKQELEKAIEEAEAYLTTVEDPVDRNILRLRCELGLEWRDVAREMSITEEACRKRFSRFMLKMEEQHDTCE